MPPVTQDTPPPVKLGDISIGIILILYGDIKFLYLYYSIVDGEDTPPPHHVVKLDYLI